MALPDTKRAGRGLTLCRDRRAIVARAVFGQRVDNLQRKKKHKMRRLQPCEKKIRKKQTFFFLLLTAAVREYLPLLLELNVFRRKLSNFAFSLSY